MKQHSNRQHSKENNMAFEFNYFDNHKEINATLRQIWSENKDDEYLVKQIKHALKLLEPMLMFEEKQAKKAAENAKNPLASCLADLITAKQLGMIRAIAREKRLDADDEATKEFGFPCKADELSKLAASTLIKRLQDAKPWQNPQQSLLPMPGENGWTTELPKEKTAQEIADDVF